MDIEKYRQEHIDRLIKRNTNLYEEENSICSKCHTVDKIVCIYCYCPLYELKECGGNPVLLENEIKDCSNCVKPHTEEFVKKYFK